MFAKVAIAVVILAVLTVEPCLSKRANKEKRDLQGKRDAPVEVFHKRQVVCQPDQFACSNYSCISSQYVCDTYRDCYNGLDEVGCPSDCSGPHQFKCNYDNKCIPQRRHCDGTADCSDWSDEASCAEYDCLEGYTHCVGGGLECIREEYRCDGDRDCDDGSDEMDCPLDTSTCLSGQFHCPTGNRHCIPSSWICDGDRDCSDGADEVGCSCSSSEFTCGQGNGCIPGSWKCDGDNDCGDMSDELNCGELPASSCRDIFIELDCYHMNQTSHPICTIYADGHKFCRKFCGLCS